MSNYLLSALPNPQTIRTGFPWTEETDPLNYKTNEIEQFVYPKITIITPSYNQASFLEETIRSVLLQNYPALEYIIIDGGSDDNSLEIIKRYEPWLSYWISERDNGQTHAINKGMIRATGEIIAYLNSDDYYMPGALFNVANYFYAHPEVDLCHGKCCFADQDSNILGRHFANINSFEEIVNIWDVWMQGYHMFQPEVFWRKTISDRIGLFNEALYFVMDYEYWCRILLTGANLGSLEKELACFRFTEGQKSQQAERMLVEQLNVIKAWLWDSSTPLTPLSRFSLQGQWIYHTIFLKQVSDSVANRESQLLRWIKLICLILRYPKVLFSTQFKKRLKQVFKK